MSLVSVLATANINVVGSYVAIIADDDITVTGTPKDYLDLKADSGTELHRWFCGDCGR